MATIEIQFDANALHCPSSNGAAMRLLDGLTLQTLVRVFDDSTEEYAHGKFRLPDDMDASGTVTFGVAVMAETAAGAKNVQHRFGHMAREDGEAFDGPCSNADSGDRPIDAAQGSFSFHTWTETVANLGWAAGDLVLFRYSRIAATADNLCGDIYLIHLSIQIPV